MGIDKGILQALLDHENKIKGPHFILSVDHTLFPQNDQLRFNHDEILKHLTKAGYDAHEIKSFIEKPYKGIVIYQVDPETAEELHELAKRCGQGYSIYSDGNAHEMRFHQGHYDGKSHYGNGLNLSENKPDGYYHALPGNSCFVSHNLDYRSIHPAKQLNKWQESYSARNENNHE